MTTSRRTVARVTMTGALVMVVFIATLATAWSTTFGARSVDATSATRTSIGAGLTGPVGLTATVAARGLQHVAALAEDGDERIWAATAVGSTDDADAVYLLGDGSAGDWLALIKDGQSWGFPACFGQQTAKYDGTTTAFLGGFEHPVPVLRTSDGALLVGDWGAGKVMRVAARS
jgi:glucose/arabinose dehydrogenase